MRVLLVLFVMAGAGCTSECEQLARLICSCEPGQTAIDACNRRAADQASKTSPTQGQEDQCKQFLKDCDCHALTTPQGQRNCGLAQ